MADRTRRARLRARVPRRSLHSSRTSLRPRLESLYAETFVADAHAARLAIAARAAVKTDGAAVPGGLDEKDGARGWDLKRALKMAVCLGAPLIAVAFLVGGGGALLGAGAAVFPYVALLACPLSMFFMMRGMQGHAKGDGESGHSAASGDANRF